MRRLGLTALLLASCAQPPASPAAPTPQAPVASSLYVSGTPSSPPKEDPTSHYVNPGAFTVRFHNAYKVRVGADGKSVTVADGPLADAVNALIQGRAVLRRLGGRPGCRAGPDERQGGGILKAREHHPTLEPLHLHQPQRP